MPEAGSPAWPPGSPDGRVPGRAGAGQGGRKAARKPGNQAAAEAGGRCGKPGKVPCRAARHPGALAAGREEGFGLLPGRQCPNPEAWQPGCLAARLPGRPASRQKQREAVETPMPGGRESREPDRLASCVPGSLAVRNLEALPGSLET
jgi:hypothetical protein